jgi:uncharacterized protein YpmS
MKKWIKRLMLLVATVLVVLLGGVMLAVYLVRSEPDYYRGPVMSVQERALAAQSAEDKFIRIQNQAARINAAGHAGTESTVPNASRPGATASADTVTITFTAAELNSFFEKWSNFQNWKTQYEAYVTEPTIVLRDGRLILAAKMKEPSLIVSLHFNANVDADGNLRLELARILGGRLPLPESLISDYEQKLANQITRELPTWQRTAKIDETGAANTSAICVAMSRLFTHMLRHEPADPLLFLPVLSQKGSVPVKILDVKITEGVIALTVRPLSRAEQTAMLARLREPEPVVADSDPARR